MLSVELANLASILDDAGIAPSFSIQAKQWSQSIREAIYEHAVSFNLATVCTHEFCDLDRRQRLCVRD